MDWNQDGILDILSGCYWSDNASAGHIQILVGKGGNDFEAAVPLKNIAGKPLENTVVSDENQTETRTICTQQHAADYDNDGDLDLIVGCFSEQFYLYENKADEENGNQSLSGSPVELGLKSTTFHSAPHLVDWDNDGDLDLLSGSGEGGVLIAENLGTPAKPDWSSFKELVAPPSMPIFQQPIDGPLQISTGTRVWATDWNGDGLMDLIVGDHLSLVESKSGFSRQEFLQATDRINKQIEELAIERDQAMKIHMAAVEKNVEPDAKNFEVLTQLAKEMNQLYSQKSEYQSVHSTGTVWLLIRKADGQQTVAALSSSVD